MRLVSFCRGALLAFSLSVLVFAAALSGADDRRVEVVGIGECADCKEQNIQIRHAFTGLHVTIDCKDKDGKFDRWGVGELDTEGKFKVSLPQQILLKDGNHQKQHECYAQLHSAAAAPCPAINGIETTKIIAKSDADGKHTSFEPAQKLQFSSALCTSATLWPFHKYPPLPKIDFWKHHHGHHYNIPKKPSPPVYKKPTEPPSKPSAPVKPLPPSEPKKKPKKEEPKKQKPPSKKKPPTVVKPPVIKPPSVKPPIKKQPCPPFPGIPKFPPKDYHHPLFPPKGYHHPKFPYFPPLSPHFPPHA